MEEAPWPGRLDRPPAPRARRALGPGLASSWSSPRARLPGLAVGLHARRHRACGSGLPLAVAETYGFVMLCCWRSRAGGTTRRDGRPAAGGPPRGGAHRDLRRGRGRPAADGGRRPRDPQRRDRRRCGCSTTAAAPGCGDVRGAGRPLPRAAPRRAPREGGEHQPRPAVRPGRVPGDPRRRPRAAAGAAGADARLHGRRAVAVVQGPQSFFNRGFGHPRRTTTPSATSRASSST